MHKEIESVFSRSENSECMRGDLCEQETSFGQAFIKTINKIQNTYAQCALRSPKEKKATRIRTLALVLANVRIARISFHVSWASIPNRRFGIRRKLLAILAALAV